ncbi:MAG: hypothetical protein AAFU65_16880, partial [Pseudomonadota bacterium]
LIGELYLDGGDAERAVERLGRAVREPHVLRSMMFGKLAQARAALGQTDAARDAIAQARNELKINRNANVAEYIDAVASELDGADTPSS